MKKRYESFIIIEEIKIDMNKYAVVFDKTINIWYNVFVKEICIK